jgi:cytochrome c-type biogenesis protein CcmF
MKDMPIAKTGFQFISKEMWLSLGSILIIGLTILIIYGTTRPILPEFLVSTKAALSPNQYDQFSIPIVLLILILNAVSLFLAWKKSKWKVVFKKIYLHMALSIIATIISFFMGIKNIPYLLLGWSAWFSLSINIGLLLHNIVKKPLKTGTFIAHLGLSALILGTIASGAYSENKSLALRLGQTVVTDDYRFTLVEKNRIEKQYKDREKYEYKIKIDNGHGSVDYVSPVVYWSDFNNFETPYFEPGIKRYLFKDIYISPKNWDFEKMEPAPRLTKGQSVRISFDTNIVVKFISFNMSHTHKTASNNPIQKFGVIVSYDIYGNKSLDTLIMEMDIKANNMNPIPSLIPGMDIQVMVAGFTPKEDMSKTEIELMIFKEIFYVDATYKPFINLVWMGVIAVVFGFFIPIGRYSKRNNKRTEDLS